VLGAVNYPETLHQSKFSMGFVLSLIANFGKAGLDEFTEVALRDPKLQSFHSRVQMMFDPEIDRASGKYWGGCVEVQTRDGRSLTRRVPASKGDPQNPIDRADLEAKAKHLAAYANAATAEEMDRIISRIWALKDTLTLREYFLL